MALFLPYLKQSGQLNRVYLTICNIGSRKLQSEDDFSDQGWHFFASNLTIYGFDADADACEAANANLEAQPVAWKEHHIPLALSRSQGESTLYVTQEPACSSLYPPNQTFLKRFQDVSEWMELDFTIDLETTTLDEFCREEVINEVDFLKVDVQGADLHVLEGAVELLTQSVLAVQVEVEPSHLYLKQPLFADVDTYMRKQGFSLFDVHFVSRPRARSPIQSKTHPGQILWGDAFYFYDLLGDDASLNRAKTPESLLKLACLADALEFLDFSLEILEYLTVNYGNIPDYNFADAIVQALSQFPQLTNQGLKNFPVIINIQNYLSREVLETLG